MRKNSDSSQGFGSFRTSAKIPPKEVKVVMVGESGVGKSSLALKFVTNSFKDKTPSTIGASFLSKTIESSQGPVKFNIWDTAGQEKYRSLAALYYRGVDCAIVVYDITNRATFDEVEIYWLQELENQCSGYGDLQLCLVGNKSDLESKRQVDTEEGRKIAESFGASFFEASAKTNDVIFEAFANFAASLPVDRQTSLSEMSAGTLGQVLQVQIPERKSKCCN